MALKVGRVAHLAVWHLLGCATLAADFKAGMQALMTGMPSLSQYHEARNEKREEVSSAGFGHVRLMSLGLACWEVGTGCRRPSRMSMLAVTACKIIQAMSQTWQIRAWHGVL